MRVIGISNRTRYWQHFVFSDAPDGYRYARMVQSHLDPNLPYEVGVV